MTRILHIISGLGVGGAEAVLIQLAGALAERGFDQQVVSLSGQAPLAARLPTVGIPVTQLELKRVCGLMTGLPHLLRLMHRFRPGIVQGWMYHGDLAATLAHWLTGDRRNRRLMWGIRCSDMDLKRHGLLIRAEAVLSRFPDAVVANSATGADVHRAHGYRPRRLEVIPNGIDTGRFRPDPVARAERRATLGLSPDRPVAIHIARVDPMKDHAGLLQAVAKLPDLQLLLVGTGAETLTLPPNATALGVSDDVPALLAAADIIVSSSAFGEGFPNALAEGMSAGLVPVTTNVGDSRLIVGEIGPVVPPRDPTALRNALADITALTNDDRIRRGRLARERIASHFAIDRMFDRFEMLYRASDPGT